jgi:hypothetical protein
MGQLVRNGYPHWSGVESHRSDHPLSLNGNEIWGSEHEDIDTRRRVTAGRGHCRTSTYRSGPRRAAAVKLDTA